MDARGHRPREGTVARRLAPALAAAAIALVAAGPAQSQQASKPKLEPPAANPAGPAAPTATDPAAPPKIDARAWILVDPRDDSVLAARAAERPVAIASATKLMTAYLALRELKPSQRLTAPPYKGLAAESLIGLRPGEKMTVRDLLYGLVLESGNDAAVTLATGVSGSVGAFVQRMNRQAEALGLTNTSYSNPIGLDAPDNFSSAADLVELAAKLLENPLFARISDSEVAVLRSGDHPRRFDTRNTLLTLDPTADGVKTGHTISAGYVLVGSATRNGTRLVSAVLGARSEAARDAETEELLDYGFSLYRSSQPVAAGEELADPELDFRDQRLPLIAQRAIEISAREGQAVETEVEAPDELSGEIEEGERLGRATVAVDGRIAASTPLVAARSVEAATLAEKAVATAQNPLLLLPAGGFVIVVGVLLAARGRRRRDDAPEAPKPPQRPASRPRSRAPRERTPEERRKMHEERMQRRRRENGEGAEDR